MTDVLTRHQIAPTEILSLNISAITDRDASFDLLMGLLDPSCAHVDYPNRVRVYQGSLRSGRLALEGFAGIKPEIMLSHIPVSGKESSVSPNVTYPGGPAIHATLYLAGVDPSEIIFSSGYPHKKDVGMFKRPTCVLVEDGEPTSWEGFTHRFDLLRTPFLGKVSVFATKDKKIPSRELKY